MSVAAASSSAGWSAVGPVYDPYAAATAAKNGDQHGLSPFDHSFSDSSSAAASGAVSSSSAVKANFLTDQEGGGGGDGIRGGGGVGMGITNLQKRLSRFRQCLSESSHPRFNAWIPNHIHMTMSKLVEVDQPIIFAKGENTLQCIEWQA